MKNIEKILIDRWAESGIKEGDSILIHSSLRRLAKKVLIEYKTRIDSQLIFDTIKKALGDKGTLILPAFNFEFPKGVTFDFNNTPSQMGALTEYARNLDGTIRTKHPIYSFIISGYHADDFRNVDNYSGYGEDSPFGILHRLNGKIGVIGLDDQHSMTFYHYVEEQNNVSYRYHKAFTGQYIDENGQESNKTYGLFVRNIEEGVKTNVNRMGEYLWKNKLYRGDKFSEGFGMRTISCSTLFDETSKIIKENEAINYLYSIEEK